MARTKKTPGSPGPSGSGLVLVSDDGCVVATDRTAVRATQLARKVARMLKADAPEKVRLVGVVATEGLVPSTPCPAVRDALRARFGTAAVVVAGGDIHKSSRWIGVRAGGCAAAVDPRNRRVAVAGPTAEACGAFSREVDALVAGIPDAERNCSVEADPTDLRRDPAASRVYLRCRGLAPPRKR